MTTIYTVNSKALLAEAAQIERDAEQSLNAWILIGESERYGKAMQTVRNLRSAAAEKSIWLRREILRNSGYTVASPKSILAERRIDGYNPEFLGAKPARAGQDY